jgi:hypothetical protein
VNTSTWLILAEVAQARAAQGQHDQRFTGAILLDPTNDRAELIQVATIAVAAIETIDRHNDEPAGVDVADLGGVAELAAHFNVVKQAVSNWAARYANFPRPVLPLAAGLVYRISEVAAWRERTMPAAHARWLADRTES